MAARTTYYPLFVFLLIAIFLFSSLLSGSGGVEALKAPPSSQSLLGILQTQIPEYLLEIFTFDTNGVSDATPVAILDTGSSLVSEGGVTVFGFVNSVDTTNQIWYTILIPNDYSYDAQVVGFTLDSSAPSSVVANFPWPSSGLNPFSSGFGIVFYPSSSGGENSLLLLAPNPSIYGATDIWSVKLDSKTRNITSGSAPKLMTTITYETSPNIVSDPILVPPSIDNSDFAIAYAWQIYNSSAGGYTPYVTTIDLSSFHASNFTLSYPSNLDSLYPPTSHGLGLNDKGQFLTLLTYQEQKHGKSNCLLSSIDPVSGAISPLSSGSGNNLCSPAPSGGLSYNFQNFGVSSDGKEAYFWRAVGGPSNYIKDFVVVSAKDGSLTQDTPAPSGLNATFPSNPRMTFALN